MAKHDPHQGTTRPGSAGESYDYIVDAAWRGKKGAKVGRVYVFSTLQAAIEDANAR